MKRLISLVLATSLGLPLAACGKDEASGPAAPAVTTIPEMQEFLGRMNGTAAKVKSSLVIHSVPGTATQDMEAYDLKDPTVTAEEKRGAQTCYTFDAKSGATTRTYVTCWEGGKIVLVEDKGMR